MKLKLMTIIFLVMMIIPISSFAITEQDNGKIKVTPVDRGSFEGAWLRGFDINGYITNSSGNSKIISSTHNNLGYHVFLNVDGKHGEMSGKYTLGKDAMKEMHYTQVTNDTIQNIDGIDLLVTTKYLNEGRQLQIIYTLTNTTQTQAKISLGTSADIEIDGDDEAKVEQLNNGAEVRLWTQNGTTHRKVQFILYGKNTKGVTDIDNLWIGNWSDYYLSHIFDNNIGDNESEISDSAFTFSWVNRTIEAGETKKYSVIIQIGELNAPEVSVLLEDNAKLYFSNAIINGTVYDKDLKETITIHYDIDDIEYTLPPITTLGNIQNFSIDLTTLNLTPFNSHKLKVWAIDSSNIKSNIEERNFTLINLKSPDILSKDEYTNENIIFKITSENQDVNVNYEYKINDETWQETQENKENEFTATEEGEIIIYARVRDDNGIYSEITEKKINVIITEEPPKEEPPKEEPPKEEPPKEEPPTEEPPKEEPPKEEPPKEEPPTEEPPTEELPKEEPPKEEPPKEEPPKEEPPKEEPPTEEPPKEEPPKEEPPKEEPPKEEPPKEEPPKEEPPKEEPPTEEPPTEEPPKEEPPKEEPPKEEPPKETTTKEENSNNKDDTIASGRLPQTGENNIIFIAIIICLLRALIYYIKLRKIKNST